MRYSRPIRSALPRCRPGFLRPAYTLFELVLVLAVIVVLGAIAYPAFDTMYGGYRLTAAVDQVRAHWASAQAAAMDQGRAYRFAVLDGKGNFRIAPDSSDYWLGGDIAHPADAESGPPLMLEDALPKGVRFSDPDDAHAMTNDFTNDTIAPAGSIDPSHWSTVAIFLPDGTAHEDVEIAFQTKGARPLLLKLRGLTGIVTMKAMQEAPR